MFPDKLLIVTWEEEHKLLRVIIETSLELWAQYTGETIQFFFIEKVLINKKPASGVSLFFYSLFLFFTCLPRRLLESIREVQFKCSCGWQIKGRKRQVLPLYVRHCFDEYEKLILKK